MIQLIKGSIFNSKCDLIIIPCNNMGGVTNSVRHALKVNNLPYLHKYITTGDVLFMTTMEKFANAAWIGYAASVDTYSKRSSEDTLRQIMKKIKNYCQTQSLQKVNIPLLGTGAGGLSAEISYKVMKSEFENEPNILLCVYAFSIDMYNEIIEEKIEEKMLIHGGEIRNPRVFISYTGSDMQNRNWVKELACRLRKCGVNARLDMFHLKPGQDLPQWMTNEIIMADKVLLICDKHYAEKADSRSGGVGWESMIIQGDMLSRQVQNKYIAIIRDDNIDESLPVYVKSRYALDWSDESQVDKEFNDLLMYLFDCEDEPPMGEVPAFIKEKLQNRN